jgi:HSP20 family protein
MTRALSTWTPRFPRSLANLESEFGNMLERMFGPEMESWSELKAWSPRANVAETDKEIEFTVELPGVKPEDVHVELHDGELWISGEMKDETEEKGKTFHKVERRYGEFRRVIPLPASADKDKVDAQLTNGVLKVSIPKSEETRPKAIKVKGGAGKSA